MSGTDINIHTYTYFEKILITDILMFGKPLLYEIRKADIERVWTGAPWLLTATRSDACE
jgi:hypothetical protein